MIACASVPVIPNELTPAILGFPVGSLFQAKASRGILAGIPSKLIAGLRVVKFLWGGINSFSRDRTTLIIPAIPEHDSVCPMFVFTDPIVNAFSALRPSKILKNILIYYLQIILYNLNFIKSCMYLQNRLQQPLPLPTDPLRASLFHEFRHSSHPWVQLQPDSKPFS